MEQGIVKWFNISKGYGFIIPHSKTNDVFVHVSQLEKSGLSTLKEGQVVQYDLHEEKGKIAAFNLSID